MLAILFFENQGREETGMQLPMRKEVLKLSYPIILQSMIVYLVMTLENLLIARISESAFAALTLTTQVYNITALVVQGITGGGNILLAKQYGAGDHDGMGRTVRLEFLFAGVFIGLVSLLCVLSPEWVMGLLTPHGELIFLGGIYLRLMGIAWFLAGCSMILTQLLRMIGEAAIPTRVAAGEMGMELALSAWLILLTDLTPERKLLGMSVLFLCLRAVEFVLLCIFSLRRMAVRTGEGTGQTEKDPAFIRGFLQTVLPVTANEFLWALGTSVLVGIIGRQPQTVIAAYGVCVTAESLASVVMSGLDLSGSMVLGKNLARGVDRVVELRRTLGTLALQGGVVEIAILLGMALLSPLIYPSLGPEVHQLCRYLLLIDAAIELGKATQNMNVTGVLRALGDVRFCFLNDFIFQWLYAIPLTWLLLTVLHTPFVFAFFCMKSDQIIKVFTSGKRINYILETKYAEQSTDQ